MTYSHCTAEIKCWPQFGSHQKTFVPQRNIDRMGRVIFRLGAKQSLDYDHLNRLRSAIDLYHHLIAARWRNCVREPFNFPAVAPTVKRVSVPSKTQTEDFVL